LVCSMAVAPTYGDPVASNVKNQLAKVKSRMKVLKQNHEDTHKNYQSRLSEISTITTDQLNELQKTIDKDNDYVNNKYCKSQKVSKQACADRRESYARKHAIRSSLISDAIAEESTRALENLLMKLIEIATRTKEDIDRLKADKLHLNQLKKKTKNKNQFNKNHGIDLKGIEEELSKATEFSAQLDREIQKIQTLLVKNVCFALHGEEGIFTGNKEKEFEQAVIVVVEEYLASNGILAEVLYADTTVGDFTPDPPKYRISSGYSRCRLCEIRGRTVDSSKRKGVTVIDVVIGMICNCEEEQLSGDSFRRVLQEELYEPFAVVSKEERMLQQDGQVQETIVVLLQEHVTKIFGAKVIIEGIPCDIVEADFN